jgi:hypothetical protein
MSALKGIAAASLLFGLRRTAAFADDGPAKPDLTITCNAAAQFALAGGRGKEGRTLGRIPLASHVV